MTNSELVSRTALSSVDVGLSVSDSPDLPRLGLVPRHAELAVGELSRAILVAGGNLTYGGRIYPSGFTQLLMHEVRRFGQSRRSVTFCLAWSEHRRLSPKELDELDRILETWGRVVCLDIEGNEVDALGASLDRGRELSDSSRAKELSGLRRFITSTTNARVLVGGQLSDFEGSMPGVIEEAILSIEAGQPVYVAGGFGGAAAAIVRVLGIDDLEWAPEMFPAMQDDDRVTHSLAVLHEAATSARWALSDTGLTTEEARHLAASHRAGEIASLVALGLARRFGKHQ